MVLAFLADAYEVEDLPDGDTRQVLRIHPTLAPYKVAVLPLVKKLHKDKAEEIYMNLSKHFDAVYDETQSIGKRYRRQDSIGTYLCITVDHDTEETNTVTVRHRDAMTQDRIKIEDLKAYIESRIEF